MAASAEPFVLYTTEMDVRMRRKIVELKITGLSGAAQADALGDCFEYLTSAFIHNGVCHIVGLCGNELATQQMSGICYDYTFELFPPGLQVSVALGLKGSYSKQALPGKKNMQSEKKEEQIRQMRPPELMLEATEHKPPELK